MVESTLLRGLLRSAGGRLVLLLALAAGLLTGLSFGESNQETYVPPGIRLVRPDFLANDWWATSTVHYHWAYSGLVAGLEAIGILRWGLALLNVAAVAVTLVAVFRLIRSHEVSRPLLAWLIVVVYFFAFNGYTSVTATYLFSTSLQSSTVATVATIWAVRSLYDEKYPGAGLALAIAACFHANFLLLNTGVFGLWLGLTYLAGEPGLTVRSAARRAAWLLGPSLLVLVLMLPLIMRVAGQPADGAASGAWSILFDFAVPAHYRPGAHPLQFLGLAGWQLLGLAWTARATRPGRERVFWVALQAALAVPLWLGTALSTLAGAELITRLFVWRLAPFAVLVAILLLAVGSVRTLTASPVDRKELGLTLLSALLALGVLTRYYHEQWRLDSIQAATTLLLPVVIHLIALGKWLRVPSPIVRFRRYLPVLAVGELVLLLALSLSEIVRPERYNLLVTPPAERANEELYAWVRGATGEQSVFLIPPMGLYPFRLKAERAIVVDWKALPQNSEGILEWYQRLEAISGTREPRSIDDVVDGYLQLNRTRLAWLRERYGVTHAVLTPEMKGPWPGWRVLYDNGAYRVIGR